MTKLFKHVPLLVLFTLYLFSFGCGSNEAGTRVGNPPTPTTQAYPSSLAITSPLQSADEFSTSISESFLVSPDSLYATSYSKAIDSIQAILEGTQISACKPDLVPLTSQSGDATCYGPTIDYQNHPDALQGQPDDGQLPSGDVGMWTANEGETNQACAAAQLNQKMAGLQFKSQAALEVLASLICVSNVNDIDLPANGETSDLVTEMNSMATQNNLNATFSTATLSLDTSSGNNTYSYSLVFEYTDNNSKTRTVTVNMSHRALDDDNTTYQGRFSYVINPSDFTGGNCPPGGTTDAGSTLYHLSSATDLKLSAETGTFCGEDTNPVGSSGLLDASDKFNQATNPDGWGNNYNLMIANFNPSTTEGNYSFAWQAGPLDDNTRTFNLTLDQDADTSRLSGTAFFGFGDPIDQTDGSIKGFICNWAGPGSNHNLKDFAQKQVISENETDGTFQATTSNLNYAPTNSCTYDGSGNFSYDSDADGTIDTNPSTPVSSDLTALTDSDSNGEFDQFSDSGFTLPTSPSNL